MDADGQHPAEAIGEFFRFGTSASRRTHSWRAWFGPMHRPCVSTAGSWATSSRGSTRAGPTWPIPCLDSGFIPLRKQPPDPAIDQRRAAVRLRHRNRRPARAGMAFAPSTVSVPVRYFTASRRSGRSLLQIMFATTRCWCEPCRVCSLACWPDSADCYARRRNLASEMIPDERPRPSPAPLPGGCCPAWQPLCRWRPGRQNGAGAHGLLHPACAGFVIAATMGNCAWFGPVVTHFATPRREVWLTIDDGPDPEDTPRLLDVLDAAGARATFL